MYHFPLAVVFKENPFKMIRTLSAVFALFIHIFSITGQEISGRVLDYDSRQPVSYASIVYAQSKGVITNEEGEFSIHPDQVVDSVVISSLGYETLTLKEFGPDMTLNLMPQTTELDQIFLSDQQLSGREIVDLVMQRLEQNYDGNPTELQFFYRQSNHQELGFDVDVKKSSIEELNQDLMDEILANVPGESGSYKEMAGVLYGDYEEQKIHIEKAAQLYNQSDNERLEELSTQLRDILLENIKDDSFLKIRTGIIGTKIQAKEIKEDLEQETTQEEIHPDTLARQQRKGRENFHKWAAQDVHKLFDGMFWKEDNPIDFFLKPGRYHFHLDGYADIKGEMVYVVDVEPKRRGDFKGKLYVNASDYGVQRLDFENVKDLSRFKLFGVSHIDDLYSGKLIFSKNTQGSYSPTYLELREGSTVGVRRPLKIIERNRVVPGRNKQNQLKLDLDIDVRQVTTYQFYVFQEVPMEAGELEQIEDYMDFQYEVFDSYNADFWKGSTIVEPNAAIKEYTNTSATP